MFILALDTATLVATVAVAAEQRIVAEYTLHHKKTHSQKLMPAIAMLLEEAEVPREQVAGVAVACGPGSFTGLRIGITTAKSLAQVWQVPVLPVPTLDALAFNLTGNPGIICPILDAQRDQVYTALYQDGKRLTDYLAINWRELEEIIEQYDQVTFLGDGVEAFYTEIMGLGQKAKLAPPHLRMPKAGSVALLGWELLKHGDIPELFSVSPLYIRKSEAEVNYEKKMGKGEGHVCD